ncbi:LPXTG cell wall anchor domain-containing protein, partial [Streptomyces sp. NPDC006129]
APSPSGGAGGVRPQGTVSASASPGTGRDLASTGSEEVVGWAAAAGVTAVAGGLLLLRRRGGGAQ